MKAGTPVAPGRGDPLAHRAEPHRDAAGHGRRPQQAGGGPDAARSRSRARTTTGPGSSPSSTRRPPRSPRTPEASPSRSTRAGSRCPTSPGPTARRCRSPSSTQQVDNALTVPIAAVKQNGSGADVVRVIDLAQGGRVTEVPVTTGLTEGSYIQITEGLHLDQLVIVRGQPVLVTVRPRAAVRHGPGMRATPATLDASPLLELESRVPRLRRGGGGLRPARRVAADHARRLHVDRGTVGLGQVHHAGPARRPRPADVGHRSASPARTSARSTTRPARGCVATRSGSCSSSSTSSPTSPRSATSRRRSSTATSGHGATRDGLRPRSTVSGWRRAPTTGRCRCRAASSSGWHSPGPSSPTRS